MPQQKWTEYAFERMEENENFLKSNLENDEVIELINDAIDIISQKSENKNLWTKSSKYFFSHPILLPSSYAINTHRLTGNLPACFRELRFLFESLAFCHYAEKEFPNEDFFIEQMKNYKIFLKKQKPRKTISQLLVDLGKDTGTESELNRVYERLSNEWVHTLGFAEKVVALTSDNFQLPSWAWILPISLDEKDLPVIIELNDYIAIFRKLLRKTSYIDEKAF
ncbi:MAG: hypothetical protein ABSG49_08875 [Methanoregula sp.]|jgi:hypothetical protein|uniref:hypothetical protein n=1 Tax=Methanoregula sp. TaxID=2052170 RepID=UPI003C2732B9